MTVVKSWAMTIPPELQEWMESGSHEVKTLALTVKAVHSAKVMFAPAYAGRVGDRKNIEFAPSLTEEQQGSNALSVQEAYIFLKNIGLEPTPPDAVDRILIVEATPLQAQRIAAHRELFSAMGENAPDMRAIRHTYMAK